MSEIKAIWISENHVDGLQNICVRFKDHVSTKRLILTQLELPPQSEPGTKRMSLQDAQDRGLSEDHCVLSTFDDDGLVKLYGALRAHFRAQGRLE